MAWNCILADRCGDSVIFLVALAEACPPHAGSLWPTGVVSGHFDVLILSCVYHDVHKTSVGTSKVPPTCSSRHPVWGSKKWRNIRTCRPKCVWWINNILQIQAKTTTLLVKWCCGVFSERSLETVSFMLVLAFFDGFGVCLRVRPKHGPTLFTVFR